MQFFKRIKCSAMVVKQEQAWQSCSTRLRSACGAAAKLKCFATPDNVTDVREAQGSYRRSGKRRQARFRCSPEKPSPLRGGYSEAF